jgi:hypothetical protein
LDFGLNLNLESKKRLPTEASPFTEKKQKIQAFKPLQYIGEVNPKSKIQNLKSSDYFIAILKGNLEVQSLFLWEIGECDRFCVGRRATAFIYRSAIAQALTCQFAFWDLSGRSLL